MRSGASRNPTSNEEGEEGAKGRGGLRKTQLRWGKPVGGREGAFLKRHDDGVGRRKGVAPDERGSAFFHSAPMHASSTTSRKCVGAGALGKLYFQALSLVELQFCRAPPGIQLRMRKGGRSAEAAFEKLNFEEGRQKLKRSVALPGRWVRRRGRSIEPSSIAQALQPSRLVRP